MTSPRKLPIPFTEAMSEAIRAGRKTMTRRIADVQWLGGANPDFTGWHAEQTAPREWGLFCTSKGADISLPYAVGDLLYVRETYYQFGHWEPVPGATTKGGKQKWAFVPESDEIRFDMPEGCRLGRHHKDPATSAWHKRLGRFMPRSASRITLRVTGVKVERLQDISEADADAECFAGGYPGDALPELFPGDRSQWSHLSIQQCFARLWESINGPGSWAANPWVCVISFRVTRSNIDAELKGA